MVKKVIIVGSGSFAKYLKNSLKDFDKDLKFYGFLSKDKSKKYFQDKDINKLKKVKNLVFINGIGNFSNKKYPLIFNKLKKRGIEFKNLIHKTANISSNTKFGAGIVITENVLIKSNVSIKDFCLINSNAIISHDTKIDAFCNISLGVKIAGNCSIGFNTLVGMGAIILNNIKVGNNVMIGAGSIVTKNLPNNSKLIGKNLIKRIKDD